MDCLKPVGDPDQQQGLTKAFDLDSAPGNQQHTQALIEKTSRLAKAALITALIFGLLSLALLGLIVWLAVDNHHNKQNIAALQHQMSQTSASSSKTTATPSLASQGTPITHVHPGPDDHVAATDLCFCLSCSGYVTAYLSQNATPATGFSSSGSLYQGSGYWAPQACLDHLCMHACF